MLQDECDVLVANDSKEALSSLSDEPVDLALIDLRLPVFLARQNSEEGLALIEVLRRYHGVRSVAISNSSGEQLKDQCLGAGAEGFEAKQDLTVERLMGVVKEMKVSASEF